MNNMYKVNPPRYNNDSKIGVMLWKKVELVQNAMNLNLGIALERARKEKMVIVNDVRFVTMQIIESMRKLILKLLQQKRNVIGINIQKNEEKILIDITKITKKHLNKDKRNIDNAQKMQQKSDIRKIILKKESLIDALNGLSNRVILNNQKNVQFVIVNVKQKDTITIMTNLLMSYGYAVLVMVKFIEKKLLKLITWKPKAKAMATGRKQAQAVQRERTNLEALFRDVMFRPTEETCRVIQKWITAMKMVSKLAGLKVTEWLRHTAGCSFYQGQCIDHKVKKVVHFKSSLIDFKAAA